MSRRKSPVNRDGLAGLLGASAQLAQVSDEPRTMSVAALQPGAGQPRRAFDDRTLAALAESIRTQGVLQPLLIRPAGHGYEIVAGERRWRAAQLAGLQEVPVIIRNFTNREARQVALIENLQREDLNVLDEVDAKLELASHALNLQPEQTRARLMQMLREEPGPDHTALESLFTSLGETWTNFAKTKLRVLNWPAPILDAVRSGLPYTLGGVIAAAPAALHDELLTKARQGASREELKALIRQLTVTAQTDLPLVQVGRLLSNRRWVASLNAKQQKDIDRWLAGMPAAVQDALKKQGS